MVLKNIIPICDRIRYLIEFFSHDYVKIKIDLDDELFLKEHWLCKMLAILSKSVFYNQYYYNTFLGKIIATIFMTV